jgi:hypothetical protein
MITYRDIDEFEATMKMYDTDANNANNPPQTYKEICTLARAYLSDQTKKLSERAAKVQKAQPVEVPKPAVVGGPDAEVKGDSK